MNGENLEFHMGTAFIEFEILQTKFIIKITAK